MNYDELLRVVNNRLDGFKQAKKIFAPRLSPDFNVFQFIAPDELSLSKILASILDPEGEHAQGDVFLKCFLEDPKLKGYFCEGCKIEIKTEASTKAGRRIDVLIDFGEAAIAIENKPWAGDQFEQVKDYNEHLEAIRPNKHCLIYLSSGGTEPTEESVDGELRNKLKEENKLIIKAYLDHTPFDLTSWLAKCMAVSRSDRVRSFLHDFSDYIRKEIKGELDMPEFDQLFNCVIESRATLQAALEIAANISNIKIQLLDKLRSQLDERIQKRRWELDWTPMKYGDTNSFWKICFFNEQQRYYLYFGFDGTECQYFHYGIGKVKEDYPDLPKIYQCLNDKIKPGKQTTWCPWYVYFPEPYLYWKTFPNPWIDIIDGTLAEMIFERSEAVYNALDKENLLKELI